MNINLWRKIVAAPTPLHLKNKLLGYIGLQEFDTPPLKPTKTAWAQFQQAQLTPYKTRLHFLAHLQARELCLQTYSMSLPLEWKPSNTQSSEQKQARSTKPKVTFLSVITPIFQDSSWSFQHAHKHSSPLQWVLHKQITKPKNQKIFWVLFFFQVLEDFPLWPATWKCHPQGHYKLKFCMLHERNTLLL